MAPQSIRSRGVGQIGLSIYSSPMPISALISSSSASPPSAVLSRRAVEGDSHSSWSNYLYIIVIVSIVILLAGFLYRRKRRNTTYPAARRHPHQYPFQAFHTHHPSQSRDLAAVHANNRVWRNMRAGPFSHHARGDSASMRAPRTSSSTGRSRSRVDVHEEVPPPYMPAEPERTLDRGPSTREMRNLRADRAGGGDHADLGDLLRGRDDDTAGSLSKPPGYEER